MASGQIILERAIDQLKSTLSPNDAREFKDTSLQQVWKVAREMERDHGSRLALRHTRRMEPLLRTLECYSGPIDTFCQGYSAMAFVWVGFLHRRL